MLDTVTRYLSGVGSNSDRTAIRLAIASIADRLSSAATTSAGLVIKTGGSALAKTGAVYQGFAGGVPVTIATNTDMPALVGTISASNFNVFCFFIDSASVVTVAMGTQATTLAGVKFPQFPEKKALVGYLIVTHGSTFTGGTTALDTATTVYVSPVGAVDPSILA